ncbi:uncharacterized protein B0I36DRAFT_380798 [Microdochium trichocladiopsis]|uniref:Uncharacterized protein n=1 Tax=Microdochium trichocladiopsis TaxID=1682393 RepID=A0A9P8YGG1_9PEZI|nr:uncharacterized protein B0I36DRAFT_380798 [Microdochium trichocladiopsis]KAH7037635.1 hypothetical protein B0I36DRAFT_380798 [Microdochium trichocladiopsis]
MALAEPWKEVIALQKDQARCATDVAAIKQACAKDHDKAHALECAECWPKLVNRLRDLYLKPSSPEWFSGRGAFLQELDGLLTKAQSTQNQAPDFSPIDQRIRKEKEEWFRDKAAGLGLSSAIESPAEARDLQSKLSDRETPIEQLVAELRSVFSPEQPDQSNEKIFKEFLGRIEAASTPGEQAGVYTDAVFHTETNGAETSKAEKYVKLIRGGTPTGEVLETLLRDRQASRVEQEERRRLRKQLEELRRAKAAHQLAQSRRDKVRQEKVRAAAAAAASAALVEQAQELPPCAACSKPIDPQGFEACPVCQVLKAHESRDVKLVVWCSEQCRAQGFDEHVSNIHECAARHDCVSITDEDTDMDQDNRVLVFCKECVHDIKTSASVFCSPRCYETNFQRHREQVHLPERERAMRQVNDRGMLEFESSDERRYRALKIEEHFITLDDALAEYSSKMGATVS